METTEPAWMARVVALREAVGDPTARAALEKGTLASTGVLSSLSPDTLKALDGSARHLLAMMLATYLVFAADGVVRDAEAEHLAALLHALTFERMELEDVEQTIETLAATLDEHGYDACLSRIASVLDTPDLRRAALRMAVGAALVDGELASEEERLVERMAHAFGISDDDADALIADLEKELGNS
jgi:uncharacterized tellurite resistance protein B-like protein